MSEYDDAYIIERFNGVCFEAIEIIHNLRAQLAALQSQPRLQPVTPEAMAELEQSEWVGIIHTCEYYTAVKGWDGKQWYDEATGNNVDRPTGGWFIDLEKLKEVQP